MAWPRAVRIGVAFDSVLAAAQGDAAWAYERLWRAYAGPIASYLRLQGAFDADDLTSEVFLGAFRGLGSFQGDEGGFRGWLFTIAHRRLTDERRRAAVRPQWADNLGVAPDAVGGDVEHDVSHQLGEDRVRELCHRLPPAQRDALLLRLIADMTVEQVADALGRTVGAAKQLQRRGLANLREILEREGVPL